MEKKRLLLQGIENPSKEKIIQLGEGVVEQIWKFISNV